MSLFQELQNFLVKYRVSPLKKLGQHFIINEKILDKMIEKADLKKNDVVFEIGAGTGFLTKKLAKKAKVKALEVDFKLVKLLNNEIKSKNVEIIEGSFLKTPLPKFNKVVSLPPYNLSKEIMLKLLEHGFDSGILVFQIDFAEKLNAIPGLKSYTALSVLTQYYCDIEILEIVSPNNFYPKPNTDSAIIVLQKKEKKTKAKNEKRFKKFLEQIFRYKNKNIGNSIQKSLKFFKNKPDEKKIKKAIQSLGLETKKTMQLEVNEFVELFNKIYN